MTTGVNHITFAVSDITRSIDFYVDVVGCTKVATWRRGAYFRAGEIWLCLSLERVLAAAATRDYTHIAFSFSAAELAALRERLRAVGAAEWKVNSSEGDSVYFLDPDGHRLEGHVGSLQTRLQSLLDAPYDGLNMFVESSAPGGVRIARRSRTPKRRGSRKQPVAAAGDG